MSRLVTKEYKAWQGMKHRVTNPKYKYYLKYSKLGILPEWVESFEKFYEYIGPAPENSMHWSIGRIENSIGYFPGNIRWEIADQQNRNRFKTEANTSGVTGVTIRKNRDKGLRAIARWYALDGKSCSKCFCESKYGEDYFLLACQYREAMIETLNAQGAGYAEDHGT